MQTNTQETKSIEDIIKMIETGKLLLPEFQRDFKWPIEKSEILFDSLFQELFIGSLIISKPKFDLVCKAFDMRERGSKKHKPKAELISASYFETKDIYTLLDGQQRTTSIYRALKGVDEIYVIFKDTQTLLNSKFYDYSTNSIKVKYDEYIEGFDTILPKNTNTFYLKICDLYSSMNYRESRFQEEFVEPIIENFSLEPEEKDILIDYALTLHKDFRSDIIKKSNLLSVQLLNMGLEKFCLYFERSNSQGLNLSFTDIITAKVYIDFKLSSKISEAIHKYKYINENLVDSIVRYINYLANNDVTKKSILKDLKGRHFNQFWDTTIKDLNYVQEWLLNNNWMFGISSIPYKTMLLPLLSFYQNLNRKEFSYATQSQLDVLKFWFYASILENRYGGGAHGSTNVIIKKDCDTMADLARGNFPDKQYWTPMRINYSYDELLKLDSNSSAKFLGLNYFMWSKSNFCNLENNAIVNMDSNVETHHLFPSSYLKTKFGENSTEYDLSDSFLNKIKINKLSNIKISNKAPSRYLNEIQNGNSNVNLEHTLGSHFIGDIDGLVSGNYDSNFIGFLNKRYQQIVPLFVELNNAKLKLADGIYENIWD